MVRWKLGKNRKSLAVLLGKRELARRIRGFPGYFVTDKGRIFRRLISGNFKLVNHQVRKKDGYCLVILRLDKKPVPRYVHRIVAEAFCDNIKNKPQVNHIDGNKLNNCRINLEWCTIKENNEHKAMNGLAAKGEFNGGSKLKEIEVKDILCSNSSSRSLALKYGVSKTSILNIKSGKLWGHVECQLK